MMHLLATSNMIGAHHGGWRHPTAYDDPVMTLPPRRPVAQQPHQVHLARRRR